MKILNRDYQDTIFRLFFRYLSAALIFGVQSSAYAIPLALVDTPLFLTSTATPLVMLNISKDHQLFFKAYDDYSDVSGDGIPDIQYSYKITYYGYFDSGKCYNYNTGTNLFEPHSLNTSNNCNGYWSGNFLNWVSTTRIDAIRKILYGGLRSTDTGTNYSSTTTSSTSSTSSYAAPVSDGATKTANYFASYSDPINKYPKSSTTVDPNVISTSVGATTSSSSSNGTNTTTITSTPTTTTYYTHYVNTTLTIPSDNPNCSPWFDLCQATTTYTKSLTTTITTAATTVTVSNTAVTGVTVLERSYLPNDAHSFAKYYDGKNGPNGSTSNDLPQLTPFSATDAASGITFCNTTYASNNTLSQNVTTPPLIRVAKGNFSLWSANERNQCLWNEEYNTSSGNVAATSGINAGNNTPSKSTNGLGSVIDYVARVKVCDSAFIGNETCKAYGAGGLTTLKPIGLLQRYGDNDQLYFGLITGSYGKNKSGGVLRKNISSMTNEINQNDGTFIAAPSGGGIINSLNLLRMYGYCHIDGTYFQCGAGSAQCNWGLNTFNDGVCNNWGNPQSEIFLESLRYIANQTPSGSFNTSDTGYFPNLTTAAWTNPISSAQWCANLNVIEFNASSSSYDWNDGTTNTQLNGAADIGLTTLNATTKTVGDKESITGNNFFVGYNGAGSDQLCTAKTVSDLSAISGTCPDAPRLSGSWQIAGLAWYGHTNDLSSSLKGTQSVTTYGVALAPGQPVVVVPVPGGSKTVTIIPACQDTTVGGNCTLVDFKIVQQTALSQTSAQCSTLFRAALPADTWNCGKFYVNWEDSEQGGDFDMDMWGVVSYAVSSSKVYIASQTVYQSTPYAMAFGYVLSGTKTDGFHAHSGINAYTYTDSKPGSLVSSSSGTGATNAYCSAGCNYNDDASTVSYAVGSSGASILQQPLWYASKWGGFNDYDKTGIPSSTADWDANSDGIPDRYYYATNPASLASSLAQAFNQVIGANPLTTAGAANTNNLQAGTVLYLAPFDSSDWSGHLLEYSLLLNGTLSATFNWDAASLIPAAANRNIYTFNDVTSTGVPFLWPTAATSTLSPNQTKYLDTSLSGVVDNTDAQGKLRLNWLRGDQSNEVKNNGILRNRSSLLGDIIDSSPLYTQAESYFYSNLPAKAKEQASYAGFLTSKATRTAMLYAGANDGMMHGFHAVSGVEQFAYVPAAVYPNLSSLTDPQYTHKYYVDGPVTVGDAYLTINAVSRWATVLLAGLDKGGKAVFALDVSNPTAFNVGNVLWEYSGAASHTDNTGVNDNDGLGYTYAQPQVARMNDGSWVAIFGNGYNSTSGQAFLYIVDLNTGLLVRKIATSSAAGNGLSTAVLYDENNDSIIDYAYAGDLQGNLWKFDLTSTSSGGWSLANSGNPLFTATDNGGNIQPITSKPTLAQNPLGGSMIYFGTGSYLVGTDVTNTNTQSFYGIWDKPSASGTATRSNLIGQTITETIAAGTKNPNANCPANSTNCSGTYTNSYRSVSGAKVDYSKNLGWYLDLTAGERVRSAAFLLNSLIVFQTIIPSDDPCIPGGTSWLMELSYLSGGAPSSSPFDLNNDSQISSSDTLPDGSIAAGVQSTVGLFGGMTFINGAPGTGLVYKINPGSTGGTQIVQNHFPTSSGQVNRRYWFQMQ